MNLQCIKTHKIGLIKLGVLSLLIVILYAPTVPMFLYDWTHDDNYSHGFLVPLIVGYIVWTKRRELQRLTPRSSLWGLVVVLSGVSIYLVGTIGAEWFLKRASLIIVLGGLIWYLYGAAYVKTVSFPIGFLIFMVPLPAIIYKSLAFQLQLFVSMISAKLIALVGIAVYRSGNILEVSCPEGACPLAVEEACSGMRSIMALLALSALFAYLVYRSRLKQWIVVIGALPIAVMTNIIRVTTTGICAHYFGKGFAEGILHESFGGLVFVIALGLLFLFSKLLDWILPDKPKKSQKEPPVQ
jgi:exosortase